MALRLDGRRVVVTGSSSGMGAGLYRALPEIGASVVGLDLVAGSGDGHAIICDVTDRAAVDGAMAAAVDHLGGLDVLVHAAGIAPGAGAEDIGDQQWDSVMAVNARGTMLTNQAAFRAMRATGGQIVNFASGAGLKGYPGKAAYAASKGAVLAWTRSVAVEWARYAITVNALVPAIWTPMYERTRASMTNEQLAAHDARLQLDLPLGGRLGDIDHDLVPVLAFLCSEDSHFMTGQTFAVDGGMVMVR